MWHLGVKLVISVKPKFLILEGDALNFSCCLNSFLDNDLTWEIGNLVHVHDIGSLFSNFDDIVCFHVFSAANERDYVLAKSL